ncbi:MAG: acetyltransferase [Gammaproteobacteria bacterium]|nr:acetyltransferase [Gammaproteobacteria bacterium]
MHYDVFNGDADGICSLHQLRLAYPRTSTLITGVKRDIGLLQQVEGEHGDSITVLDISLDKNREALLRLLNNGLTIDYFDHHFAGEIPPHPSLMAQIDTASEVCTGLLVNNHLGGRYLPWAVVAAFGDNLFNSAVAAARELDYDEEQLRLLEVLGTLLNYNGYGSQIEDLFFHPRELYEKVSPYESPFDFINSDAAFATLNEGYSEDMQHAAEIGLQHKNACCAMLILPNQAWARRVSGVYSNQLARDNPDRAHALLTELPDGDFQVSVRAPLNNKTGADDLCRQFPSGGGRKAAAGINHLPASELDAFNAAFQAQFGNGS